MCRGVGVVSVQLSSILMHCTLHLPVHQVIRIGLMGYNCEKSNVDMALHALADALKNCKKSKV